MPPADTLCGRQLLFQPMDGAATGAAAVTCTPCLASRALTQHPSPAVAALAASVAADPVAAATAASSYSDATFSRA